MLPHWTFFLLASTSLALTSDHRMAAAAVAEALHRTLDAQVLFSSVAMDASSPHAVRAAAIWAHLDLLDVEGDSAGLRAWTRRYAKDSTRELRQRLQEVVVSVEIAHCTEGFAAWTVPMCPPAGHVTNVAACLEDLLGEATERKGQLYELAADAYSAAGQSEGALRLRETQLRLGYDHPADRLFFKIACDYEQAGNQREALRFHRLNEQTFPRSVWGAASRERGTDWRILDSIGP